MSSQKPYLSKANKISDRYQLIKTRGFPGGSLVKNLPANAGDLGSIPGLRRCPGEGNSNPLQYSCLGNPMDRGSLAGYSPWGHKEYNTTQRQNNNRGPNKANDWGEDLSSQKEELTSLLPRPQSQVKTDFFLNYTQLFCFVFYTYTQISGTVPCKVFI